ncbi:putative CRISPR-associated protein CasA/Cse1, type TIGR02547 [Leptospira weilii serovar Ranarum str. ICFT]|uniref:CRISPR-associated protein CasA/Cse1, type TIGR02547 n=1 Tax=Leptospira weilii serovar Ranarum str. ICFT TaxID=1218598 RepID=N1WGE0_9LEPT|nr:type I-E CRISPR-associated protein Cse1/CasA [Leptospira weilii]EMY77995.1 putative CRISPR-associated protein CasA/Cse1, type TIGR02547 [Leptospira weilii serovar Ranarum str. ICFT]
MFSFNLITEKWIPVKTVSGDIKEVSLTDALLKARDYKKIEDPSPLVVASLYRFLLAVLHRALKGPTEVSQNVNWFENGFPEKEILDYLEKWKDRFDLFHPKYPFYQVADLPNEFMKHWHILTAESGSGSTSTLYNHNNRKNFAECEEIASPSLIVKKILEHQNFTLGGLIRKIQYSQGSAPSATSAIMISKGKDLHETFCLNLVTYNNKEADIDTPVWERDSQKMNLKYMKGKVTITKGKKGEEKEDCQGAKESILGFTNLYTWISRSIKVLPEKVDDRIIIKNILYASGISINRETNILFDPMVSYKKSIKKGLISINLNKDKALWRDFNSILPQANNGDLVSKVLNHSSELVSDIQSKEPIKLSFYGQVSNKGKIELYRSEHYNISNIIIKNRRYVESLNKILIDSEKTFSFLKKATFDLLILTEPLLKDEKENKKNLLWKKVSNPPPPKEQPLITKLRATIQKLPSTITYWSTLESQFSTFLSQFTHLTPEDNENWWLQKLIETVNISWQKTCDSIGINVDSMKAIAIAQRTIDIHCLYLSKLINGEENV